MTQGMSVGMIKELNELNYDKVIIWSKLTENYYGILTMKTKIIINV